jgi:DNA-binding NtrC family response regulator
VYAAASRLALEAIERGVASGGPLALIVPSGVDPLPYLARAHLHGAHKDGAFVAIDGTNAREHDVGRWSDRRSSPLALADGGILVLLDVGALPAEVQQVAAHALTHRRPPWDSPDLLDIQLAITGVVSPGQLVAHGRLDPGLATLLGDALSAPVTLPRLRDRPEDLRNVLTDHLAREGLRALGRPVGIERAALIRLVDYAYPGEEAELAGIVRRLVARCEGDIVRAADVDAVHPVPVDVSRIDPLSV